MRHRIEASSADPRGRPKAICMQAPLLLLLALSPALSPHLRPSTLVLPFTIDTIFQQVRRMYNDIYIYIYNAMIKLVTRFSDKYRLEYGAPQQTLLMQEILDP